MKTIFEMKTTLMVTASLALWSLNAQADELIRFETTITQTLSIVSTNAPGRTSDSSIKAYLEGNGYHDVSPSDIDKVRAYLAGKLAELDTNHKEFMTLATEADDAYLAGNLRAGDALLKKQIPLQERCIELLEDPLLAFFTDLDEWLPTAKADLKMMKTELGAEAKGQAAFMAGQEAIAQRHGASRNQSLDGDQRPLSNQYDDAATMKMYLHDSGYSDLSDAQIAKVSAYIKANGIHHVSELGR